MTTRTKFGWIILCCVVGLSLLLSSSAVQPPSGTWAPTGDMAAVREGAAAVSLADGRVLVIGGTGADGQPSASVESYSGGVFTSVASMNAARSGHSCSLNE